MDDREGRRSGSLGSRFRGVLGQVRDKGAASLRGVRRTVGEGVAEASQRLRSGQEAVGSAVEARRLVRKAQDAQRRGNPGLAYRLLEPEIQKKADDPKLVVAFWEAALATEQVDYAVAPMKRLIRTLAGGGKLERAAELWRGLRAGAPGVLLDAASLVRIASALIAQGEMEPALDALRDAVDPENAGLSPGLAVRVAETARQLDPRVALAAARRALDAPDFHEAKRARLQELVRDLEGAVAKAQAEAAAQAAAAQKAAAQAATAPQAAAQAVAPAAARPAPREDVEALDADDLAQQIGALADADARPPPTAGAELGNERFLDLGAGDDGEPLEVGQPPSARDADPAVGTPGERFVSLEESDASPLLEVTPEPDAFDALQNLGVRDLDPAADDAEPAPARKRGPVDLAEQTVFDASSGLLADPEAEEEPLPVGGATEIVAAEPFDLGSLEPEAEGVAGGEVLDADELSALEGLSAEPDVPEDDASAGLVEAEPYAVSDAELEASIEVEPEPSDADVAGLALEGALDAALAAPRFAGLKRMDGTPTAFGERELQIEARDGRRGRIEYAKVQALAVARVEGLARRTVVVIDLLLNWNSEGDTALRVVRLRGDGFDPGALVPGVDDPDEALRGFLAELLSRTGAVPLPEPDAALGLRLPHFDSVERYEREVLQVGA